MVTEHEIFMSASRWNTPVWFRIILVTRASDRSKALGNSMSESMRRRVLIAKNWRFESYGACSLLELTWMHQLETLLLVLHEHQWEDTLLQGSPELFSPSVKRRALGSRLVQNQKVPSGYSAQSQKWWTIDLASGYKDNVPLGVDSASCFHSLYALIDWKNPGLWVREIA